MRIGLFGGTFNPIHFGHLDTVNAVRTACALDIVFFIPSAIPPHKGDEDIVDARDRLAMTLLAVAPMDGFMVSDIELRRSGPSYTVDTIRQFKDMLPADTALFFILGADAFLEIDTWKAHERLFDLISMIVMARPGAGAPDIDAQTLQVGRFLSEKISPDYAPTEAFKGFRHPRKQAVTVIDHCPVAASATDVRNRLHRRQDVRHLVPPAVADYINQKGLYR